MKNILIALAILPILLASCDNDLEDTKDLAEQLSGEWNVVRMTFPANDSTVNVNGQARFGSCINDCKGYFDINDEVVNFVYNVTHFSGGPSQMTLGPAEGEEDNGLNLQTSNYNILVIDDHNLTIDLTYCEFTDNVCTTIHRHIVMTR